MHDIDRTQFEADELTSGYGGELEQPPAELPLNEMEELELASGLLEVSDEMELEAFLGDVFRTVGRALGQFARSDAGRAVGGVVKDAIRQALPGLGAPGGGLAQQAGSLLGLELEGLSPEDKEFETARQLVRFAGNAYRNAAWAPRHMSAPSIARAASLAAARRYAPGLQRTFDHRRRGSWQSGRGRYGSAPRYRYDYGAQRSGGQPSYYQPTSYQPAYYRRRRRPSYGQAWYPWGYWPAMAQPEPEPEPAPPPPPPVIEPGPPAATAEPVAPTPPAAAEPPPPAAAPQSSSELEAMGMNGHRRGRWVRRDGVLIVYGA